MITRIDRNTALNALSGFLAGYGWVAFACFLILVEYWAHTSPATPDPAHGYIFRHNEHGTITYFSGFQGTGCWLLFTTSIPLFFLAVAICPKKKVVARKTRFSFSMRWEPDDPRSAGKIGSICGAIAAPLIIFLAGPYFVAWLNLLGFVTAF